MKIVIAIIAAFAVTSAGANSLPLAPVKTKPKTTLQRKTQLKQNPQQHLLHRQQSNRDLDDSDLVIDDEITLGRNRRNAEFGNLVVDEELSDYVKFRLWLARQLALRAYNKVQG